nr:inverse autotransporter beta domain-containing protein [Xenorhabdus sp. BG5]
MLSLSLSFPSQAMAEDQNQDPQAQKLAEITAQWGQLTQSQSPNEAAKTMAAQQLSSAVTSTLTPWLNQYGNARLTLPFDSHFSLKDVAFDGLLPWYNVASGTAFSQLGVKTHHGQTTTTLGFGYRYLADNWLWGVNAFWDALWPEQHHRYSIGLEAWHDNIKLSANLYQRLSHWKPSRLTDFDARPANGWDIQAEAGLPAFPHWGGQLKYEHYYGQQVALFGEAERQKNPYSVTAGLTYMPVPLVTLGADFRQGKHGVSENRFTLNLNYRLGVPFSQQLDPNAVAPLRSLRASQFDFVNRRSDMVLDYQKQTLITLAFPASINGYEGKEATFVPVIQSKYPLARLELDMVELQQTGGKILYQQPNKVTLRLPKTTKNPVRLSGIAIDSRGNRSNRAEIMIMSLPTEKQLKVSVNKTQAKADGHDRVIYTVLVTDQEGTPIPNQAVIWSSDDKGALSQTRQNTDTQGQASVVLHSRQQGLHTVRVSVAGEVTVAPSVQFDTVLIPEITVDKHRVKADGKARVMLTVTVKSADGQPVPNQAIVWQTSLGQFSAFSLMTDKKGQATAYLASKVSGNAEVTVAVGSETVMSSPIGFTDSLAHTLQADKQTAIADGQDSIFYTVNVRDAADRPVANIKVQWSTDNGQLLDKQSQTNSQGEATVRLVSRTAGRTTVKAEASGKALHAASVMFERLLKPAVTVDKVRAKGDGQDAVVLTARVLDSLGSPVENQPVIWQTDHGVLSSERTQTDPQGQAQVQLSSTFAGEHQVQIQVGNNKVAAPIVLFEEVLLSTLRVNKTRAAADGEDRVIFTVTVTDIHGQELADKAVDWSGHLGEMIFAEDRTDRQGKATAIFVSRHAGQALVTADVGEQQVVSSVEFITPLRLVDTVAIDRQGGNANQKSFGLRGPSVLWHGAKFRLITAGNTGRVSWQSNSPSVTVSGDVVTVQQNPDGIRLTGTDETGQQVELTLTVHTWFERSGLTKDFYSNAKQLCKSLGSRIASKYALERLYEEWGNFYLYDGWAREFYVTSTDYLAASSGSAEHQAKWAFWAETDRWMRNGWPMTGFACGK